MNFDFRILFSLIIASSTIKFVHTLNSSSVLDSQSYVVSCGGSNSATDYDGRKWKSDFKFLTSSDNSITAKAIFQDPSLPSTVPYMNARAFKSESTYQFSVSPNSRYWVRLHFYPAHYDHFDSSDSYFSTIANGFIFLHNFSASITSQALSLAYIIREFSITPIPSATLNLTFIPQNGSLAFVNGIEVIPMPGLFISAPLVGFSNQHIEAEDFVLQTMIRLNVGGQFIAANKDSGLSRTWFGDASYIYGSGFGVTSQADNHVKITYPDNVPTYIAPVDVYRTARTMGPSPRVNLNYNLTWLFQVDANFSYLVRLHFCEYQLWKINERVFDIFLNNQTAFSNADVIAWSRGNGVPVYKDFAVYVTDEELWVALHPSESTNPECYDAILNGLEIFKINDTQGNLAGPNPVPSALVRDIQFQNKSYASSKSLNSKVIIGAVLGSLVGCVLVFAIVAFVFLRKMNARGGSSRSPIWLTVHAIYNSSKAKSTTSGESNGSSLSTISGSICRHFSLAELRHGTKNFDESQVIGVGGFGKVYKGIIDGKTQVAIKRANQSSQQGLHEFQTEIDLLSKLRHLHLVSLIGACEENDEMILVYDYMANGTLREHLYKGDNRPRLPWKQRLEICIGAARGLHYLHTGARHTIIHRDVKTTNILLDDKWVAKVSDFGLSKTGPSINETHVSTVVKGSFGYLDPEYFRRQQLTEKSDVYSFGVVLFEVLSGRPALDASLSKEQVSLADWALQCHNRNNLEGIMDPHIKEEISLECLNHFVETAMKCLSDQGINRPSMGAVLWNLEFALQLHANPKGPKFVAEQKANTAYAMHTTLLSIKEEAKSSEGSEDDSKAIFSQLVNPQGR